MALSTQQKKMAALIYGIAIQRGLNHARAKEMVAAAYAESGLNPTIRNKRTQAAGLFQLLSPGYVNRANQMGGVDNPRANINAIIPDYISYWRSHPNAAPGEAARDVERSGEGAGFYSAPLKAIGPITGVNPATLPTSGGMVNAGGQGSIPAPQKPPESPHAYSDFALSLINAVKTHNPEAMMGAIMTLRNATKPQPVTQPTLGGVQSNQGPRNPPRVTPGGGGRPLDEMIRAEQLAKNMGLTVGENYNEPGGVHPVHVKNSYHYRRFPANPKVGRAIDVTGPAPKLSAYTKRILGLGGTAELFYDPLGGWKYGKSIGPIGHHGTHVHVAY